MARVRRQTEGGSSGRRASSSAAPTVPARAGAGQNRFGGAPSRSRKGRAHSQESAECRGNVGVEEEGLRRQGMENRRRAGRRVGLGAVRNQESGQIWIGSTTDDLELVLG